jgi:hypothetical protein
MKRQYVDGALSTKHLYSVLNIITAENRNWGMNGPGCTCTKRYAKHRQHSRLYTVTGCYYLAVTISTSSMTWSSIPNINVSSQFPSFHSSFKIFISSFNCFLH